MDNFQFNLKEELGLLLWQASVILQRNIKSQLEEHNINYAQFIIMQVVFKLETMDEKNNQTSIIKYSKLDKMTVSKSLERLTTEGYIFREEDQSDTRSKNVFLTVEGKRLLSKLHPVSQKIYENHFKSLSDQEITELKNSLRKILN